MRETALARILSVLDLQRPEGMKPEEFQKRVNPSPAGADLRDANTERAICGTVAADFGYDL